MSEATRILRGYDNFMTCSTIRGEATRRLRGYDNYSTVISGSAIDEATQMLRGYDNRVFLHEGDSLMKPPRCCVATKI